VRPRTYIHLQGYLTYKKMHPLGPYRRPVPGVLGGSWGERFLMDEVPLYGRQYRAGTVLFIRISLPIIGGYWYLGSEGTYGGKIMRPCKYIPLQG